MSKREQILIALYEKLKTLEDVSVLRNEVIPQTIPKGGLIVLRDGKPGEPEILLSPPICIFHHEAEIEILIQDENPDIRSQKLDELMEKVAALLISDTNLHGITDYLYPKSPGFIEDYTEGAPTIKAAVIPVILEYSTTSTLT